MNHHERHVATAERERSDVVTVSVSRSDGGDGYHAGSWCYQVSQGGWGSPVSSTCDGGFSSREHATEEAARVARRLAAEGGAS